MQSSRSTPAEPGLWVLRGLCVAIAIAYVIWTIPGVRPRPGFVVPFDGVLQGTGYVSAAVLAVVGAVRARERTACILVAVAIVLRAIGFVLALSFLGSGHPLSFPSVADAAWVLSTLALIGAVLCRLHERAPRLGVEVLLDGCAASMLVLAVAVAILSGTIRKLNPAGTPHDAVVVNVVYPVLDVALLIAVVSLAASVRRRLRSADTALTVGVIAFAAVDVTYLVLLADGRWRPGNPVASLSLVATLVIAGAVAAAPARSRSGPAAGPARPDPVTTSSVTVPVCVILAALTGTAVAGAVDERNSVLVLFVLAGATAVSRGVFTLSRDRRDADAVMTEAAFDVLRFQALVEASGDFIGMADLKGRVVYLNPVARRVLGIGPRDAIEGITAAHTVRADERTFALRWAAILRDGGWSGESNLWPLKGDDAIPVEVSTFVVRDPRTRAPFAVATIQRDIRARRTAEATLRDLADQRGRLLERLVQAQEDERARIAADVHDDSVQALAAVDLRLGLLRRRTATMAPELAAEVEPVQQTVREATSRLRHLLFDLGSPSTERGLVAALSDAAAFVFEDSPVRWQVIGEQDVPLPEALLVTAYRIAKEAMVNVVKHADATQVTILVAVQASSVSVSVSDDGRGLEHGADRRRPGHMGLAAARDHAAAAGGSVDVAATSTGGTEVTLTLPVPIHGDGTGSPS